LENVEYTLTGDGERESDDTDNARVTNGTGEDEDEDENLGEFSTREEAYLERPLTCVTVGGRNMRKTAVAGGLGTNEPHAI
jgi:hypothetical protein